MADDNEVLIVVEVDQSASLADLQQTTESVAQLEQAQEHLNKAVADGKITSDQYKQSRSQLDAQLGTAKNNQKNLTDSVTAGNKSLTEGVSKNKALGKEVNTLGKEVAGAKKSTDAFGAGIDKYGGALDSFGMGAKGAIQQVQGLTKASLTFLATPIGAIIGAIVAVLGTLAAYFKNTGDGADQFAKIMAQLSTVMDVLIDRVSAFGRGVFNILTGNWEEGFNQISNSIRGVGEEMEREVTASGQLAEALDMIEDAEKDYNVQATKTRNEIRLLEVQAKDRTKSEESRAKLLEKALEKEIGLNAELTQIRRAQLEAATQEVAQRANMQREENESLEAFADRLVANEQLADGLRDKVREGIKALNTAEGESLVFQEKIQDKRNKLLDDAATKRKKDAEDEKKLLAEKEKEKSRIIDQEERSRHVQEVARQKEFNDIKAKAEDEFAKTSGSIALQILNIKKETEDQLTGLAAYNAGVRKLIASQEFQDITAAFNATADLAQSIMKSVTDIRKEEAEQQIATIELQKQAELALISGAYEEEINELNRKFKAGELSEEEYNEKRKVLDTQYKDQKTYIEQLAAYEQEQIKKKAFEDNKKIRIADSIIDAIQAGLAAFRSLAPVPFVGPVLGAAAAAAALAFGYKQVDLIRSQQYVGSGATVPQPPSAPNLEIPVTNFAAASVDGGIITSNATQPVNDRLPAEPQIIRPVVSIVEINDANDRLSNKVEVAELS